MTDLESTKTRAVNPSEIRIKPPPSELAKIALTRFDGPEGSRLTKSFTLDDDGNIAKDSAPMFSNGHAETVHLAQLSDVEKVTTALQSNECIGLGIFDLPSCEIVTAHEYNDAAEKAAIRTRTKRHMKQPNAGLALLDYDSSPFMPEQLRCETPAALMEKIIKACPEFESIGYSACGSASSGIYKKDTNEAYTGGGGMHIYIADGNVDLEQLRHFLEVRLWLTGFGCIAFARNGAMLMRTIVDTSVLSPERIIYEARPVLGEGIGQRERVWTHSAGTVLQDIPTLTDEEVARYKELVAEAKRHPETVARAEALLGSHHIDRVTKLAAIKKIDFEEAEKQLPRRTLADLERSSRCLDLNDTIEIGNETILVCELLERGAEFDGKAMPDPIEGSAYGKTTAKFYYNDGNSPCIHSFAHGQKTVYVLPPHKEPGLPDPSKGEITESCPVDLTKPLNPEKFPHTKLQQNGTIKLLPTIDNHAHLCRGYGITLGYNVMKKEPVITIPGFSGSIENYFSNTIETICSLAALNGMDTRQVPRYLNVLADRNPINPIAEWITSVPWDGVDRVEAISDTLVVHEDFPIAFKGKLVKKFLTSAVAAATLPSGFQSRGILTIQGPQGIGKTSWARNLVPPGLLGDQYVLTGHHLDASSKDSIVAAITHWFVEIGEVDSSLKKNVALLKGFITQKHDSIRLWYGRAISKFQRRTVFIATVNDPNFLVDQTGNSRFWTLPVTKINYNHGIDMQQLYRQLYDEIQQGAEWWLNSEGEAQLEELNQVHRAVNAVEERVMMVMNPNLPSERWAAKKPIEVLLAIGFRNPSNRQCKDCADVLRREYGTPKKIQGAYKYRIPLDLSRVPNS